MFNTFECHKVVFAAMTALGSGISITQKKDLLSEFYILPRGRKFCHFSYYFYYK